MDSEQFDRWTRLLAQPRRRRGVIGLLAGGAAAFVTRQAGFAQIERPGQMCGGIAVLPCPAGFICIDDPNDDCDPETGGADCPGVCVPIGENPCAAILCIEGTTCCPHCGGLCIPDDVTCSEALCVSEPCNQTVCGPGEYCCNESCSRCAALGESCTQELCLPAPGGVPCGPTTCPPGQVCCNESCGICTPPGGMCIAMYCG
jgi:hypothetical protein